MSFLGMGDIAGDSLVAQTYFISPAWARIGPTRSAPHGDPRFERLVAQTS
jgi:hypothetical protein